MPATHSGTILSRLTLIVLGVIFGLATVEMGMRAAGRLIKRAQRRRNQQTLASRHEVRILCLGESTTAGLPGKESYPEMLERILNRQALGIRFAVVNQGRIGATTSEITAALEHDLEAFEPDLVVAMMGINDRGGTLTERPHPVLALTQWIETLRVHKLYRLLRSLVSADPDGDPGGGRAVVRHDTYSPPEAGPANRPPGDIPVFPPVPPETAARLQEAATLISEQEYEEAEAILAEVLRETPAAHAAYVHLARVYRETDRPEEAHRLLARAVKTATPPSLGLLDARGRSHLRRGDTEAAIRAYRFITESFLEESQVWDHTYYRVLLADIYEESGQLELAERTLREISEEIDPGNDIAYRHLAEFYERHGVLQRARKVRETQARIRREHVRPMRKRNSLALRAAVRARGIPLVAVQYPGRSVEKLRRIYDNDASVVYVDNGVFKERAQGAGYDAFYVDRFAGDFGHLTEKGKWLLARNVARAIVQELFGQPLEADAPIGS